MRQTSFKSNRVAELLDEITRRTGETRVDAVTAALEQRLEELTRANPAERTLAWLEQAVWPELPEARRGRAPSKAEQEDLLGF